MIAREESGGPAGRPGPSLISAWPLAYHRRFDGLSIRAPPTPLHSPTMGPEARDPDPRCSRESGPGQRSRRLRPEGEPEGDPAGARRGGRRSRHARRNERRLRGLRSEERRVGKECRARWWTEQEKKNKRWI